MSFDFASALRADHVGDLVLSSDAGMCLPFLEHKSDQHDAVSF